MCVITVDNLFRTGTKFQVIGSELLRNFIEWFVKVKNQLLPAKLHHQSILVLYKNDFSVIDNANTIRHLLGLLDVVRRQYDGDARVAQASYDLPHILP